MERNAIEWTLAGASAFVVAALVAAFVVVVWRAATAPEPAVPPPVHAAQQAEPPVPEPEPEPAPPGEAEPLRWERPRFAERREERHAMVREQVAQRDVQDQAVLDAMRHVPRHLFVPERLQVSAYADRPLPIGHGQTISQPYVVAFMTEMLELEPGEKVLEIGTGSGYQAAVLSELTPHVFTIEIIEELAEQAAERLDSLGYETIRTRHADGYYGWPEEAPVDAVIVTAAAGHVPPPLIEQLAPGGRMAIPVGGVYETQQLLLVTRDEDGEVSSRSLLPVRFVPMTGRAQEGGP